MDAVSALPVYNASMNRYLRHFFDLLFAMTGRELRTRYKYTLFGFFWMIANPLVQMLVIGFVFTFFMKEPAPQYYLYLFSGLLVWNFFSLSLTKSTPSIVAERLLIKKSSFPRSVIPLSVVCSTAVHLLLAQCLFLIPLSFVHTLQPFGGWYVVAAYGLLFGVTVGMTLMASALNVRFRDINFLTQALLVVWFYATPIVYPLSVVPAQYAFFWYLNPLTVIVQLFSHALIGYPLPEVGLVVSNGLLTVVLLILGISIFHTESKNFDDWV